MATCKSINLNKFLQDHRTPKGEVNTHGRIGDEEKKIYNGSYIIPNSEWVNFMQLYYQAVIVKGQLEYPMYSSRWSTYFFGVLPARLYAFLYQ